MLSDCDVKVYKLVSLTEIVHPRFPVSRVLKLLSDHEVDSLLAGVPILGVRKAIKSAITTLQNAQVGWHPLHCKVTVMDWQIA